MIICDNVVEDTFKQELIKCFWINLCTLRKSKGPLIFSLEVSTKEDDNTDGYALNQ